MLQSVLVSDDIGRLAYQIRSNLVAITRASCMHISMREINEMYDLLTSYIEQREAMDDIIHLDVKLDNYVLMADFIYEHTFINDVSTFVYRELARKTIKLSMHIKAQLK